MERGSLGNAEPGSVFSTLPEKSLSRVVEVRKNNKQQQHRCSFINFMFSFCMVSKLRENRIWARLNHIVDQ